MTNREYMESLSDKDLAYYLDLDCPPWVAYAKERRIKGNLDYYYYVERWLKEKHVD